MKSTKLWLAAMLASLTLAAFGQQKASSSKEKDAKPAAWAISDVEISASLLPTPYFKIENETPEMYKAREKEMQYPKHWIAIDVTFRANMWKQGSPRKWSNWLDNIEIKMDAFIPACDDQGRIGWGVLSGEGTLNSISADNGIHYVRMMITPDVLYRNFAFGTFPIDTKSDYQSISSQLKKYADELPIYVTVNYGGTPVAGAQVCGRDFYKRVHSAATTASIPDVVRKSSTVFDNLLKPEGDETRPSMKGTNALFKYISQQKFNPQTFKYMPDQLLPVSKTPFAWVEYDRFETFKESTGK